MKGELGKNIENRVVRFGKSSAKKLIPPISLKDNKSRRGRVLLFAGSEQFPGAGILAAKSAARMGSGYVILAQKGKNNSTVVHPDFIFFDLNKRKWNDLKFDAILVGPGFGVNSYTAELINDLKKKKVEKVVLDADALTICAQEKLFPLLPTWIVTPHSGELARCLGVTSEIIENDRLRAIRKAQKMMNCVVLLKGHHSLVASSKKTYQNKSGNSALAKAGTGDVLAGMITSLRAQGLGPIQATLLGTYLHGACANLWVARGKDHLSMMASDIIEILPELIFKLRQSI